MAAVSVSADAVEIRLTTGERIAGLLRDLRVPRSAISSAEVVDDGLAAARGWKAPGLDIPSRKIGSWRHHGTRQFVCVRRGEPTLRLNLTGQPYDSALISTPDAARLAREIGSGPPTD